MIYAGIGFDAHKYSKSKGMYLGTLYLESEYKFEADSDGDIIVHSILNSILSALQEGDLGSFIGLGKFITGIEMIEKILEIINEKKAKINNISVQFIGNKPKIAPIRKEMEERLSKALDTKVSISSSTTDKMGWTGKGEGACSIANCIIEIAN